MMRMLIDWLVGWSGLVLAWSGLALARALEAI